MSVLGQLLCPAAPLGPCEVSKGAGRTCGEDGVAVVYGKTVCKWHQESASEVAALALKVMRSAP